MKSRNYEKALEQFRKTLTSPDMKQGMKYIIDSRDVVLARYQPIFNPKNIQTLSEEDFRSFLYFENNRHWSGLYRHVTALCKDMDLLREALSILLDEKRLLVKRYDEAVKKIRGLGRALATAILLVSYPDKYGVLNNTSENALRQVNLWKEFVRGRTPGQRYERVNNLLLSLANDLGIDLWTLDALMWGLIADDEESEEVKEPPAPVLDSVSHSLLDEIHHPELRDRLSRLSSAPLDTVIREAGVIFEHYLRNKVDPNSTKFGVDLIDDALKSGDKLVFSSHGGEQQGVYFLFRGAMQFIRNPPMHKIIDYPESMAQQSLRLIDSLMTVLDHAAIAGEVTVDDIRFLLRSRIIRSNQMALYRLLYEAGSEGLTSSKLADAMKLTPQQLSGVLGALGRAINNTEGLEDKGGISLLFEITETNDGEWQYRMRSILQKALEDEGLVQ